VHPERPEQHAGVEHHGRIKPQGRRNSYQIDSGRHLQQRPRRGPDLPRSGEAELCRCRKTNPGPWL